MTEPTYTELRQQREEEPKGGNYLKARDYPNGADVTVTGTEVRQNGPQAQFDPGAFVPYWVVNVKNGPTAALLKENKTMSAKLAELDIEDPVGRSFILTTVTIQTNKTWAIARAL